MQDTKGKKDELDRARNSVIYFSLMMTLVSSINFLRWRSFDPAMDRTWILSLVAFSFMSWMIYIVKNNRVWLCSMIFWFGFCVAVADIAEANIILLERLDNFTPFGGFKLLAMGLAILAPYPYVNGFIAIGLCALVPIVLQFTLSAGLQSKIPLPEPGITVVASIVALGGLLYRLKGIKIERENARFRAEKESLDEFAHILLVLRDLTNTPLQVIGLTTELMQSGRLNTTEAAERLHDSVNKLALISQLLSKYQFGDIPESQMKKLYDTHDPIVFLQKRLDDLKSKSSSVK